MAEQEEEGFTVRDRRRFLSEETAAAETPPPPPPPAAQQSEAVEEEFDGEDAPGDGALPDVYSFLAMFMGELRNLAWFRMGLVANPATGEIERDMAQAKVAIDTVAFLASQIETIVPAEERMPLRALVSDLQINFVEQSKKG